MFISSKQKLIVNTIIFLAVCVLVSVRFINLLADFPPQLNWSGDLYTDEGWYASGALHKYISGQWLIEGDFNPIISMPFYHLAQYVVFNLNGLSLTSTRITSLIFFIILISALWAYFRIKSGYWTALVAILLLSTDFIIFIYSRLSFLELPMLSLVMVCMLLLTMAEQEKRVWLVFPSGGIYLLALLTKATALFALPALVLMVALFPNDKHTKIRKLLIFFVSSLAVWGGYIFWMKIFYTNDYQLFARINFQNRITWQLNQIIINFKDVFTNPVLHTQPVYWSLFLVLILTFMFCIKKIFDPQVISFVILFFGYGGMLSMTNYHPPRYFVPMIFLINALLTLLLSALWKHHEGKFLYKSLYALIIIVVLLLNTYRGINYLTNPKFTFINMLQDVKKELSMNSDVSPVIVGPFANTVGLETKTLTINSFLGTKDLEWKIKTFEPRYFLALGKEGSEEQKLKQHFSLKMLKTYDVFENYQGKQVILYQLIPLNN